MGTSFFRFVAIVISCGAVAYEPSSSFEFFRNLIVLSAGMSYDFWSKYVERVNKSGISTWREQINIWGFAFFIVLFLIGFFGLTDFLTIDLNVSPHILRTSEKNMLQYQLMEVDILLFAIMIFPFSIFLMDILFNGSVKSKRRDKK